MTTAPLDTVEADIDSLALTTDIVSAFLVNNSTPASAVPELITAVHRAILGLARAEPEAPARATGRAKPAVPVSKSVFHDHLICLEDGKKLTMLKRYLRSRYGLSPEEYRRRWGLPPEYPMVAPAYAAQRSVYAKQIGLGKGVRSKR